MTNDDDERPEFQDIVVNSLSGVYLWLFFGYLSAYINCDLQRILRSNPYVLHAFGFFTFFFLFTSNSASGSRSPWVMFGQTIVVYLLWVLASKTKAPFVFTVLGLLLCHQVAFVFLDYYLPPPPHGGQEQGDEEKKDVVTRNVRRYLNLAVLVCIVAVVIAGVGHYMYLQMIEYKGDFSFLKFFVDRGGCKARAPDYDLMQKKK